MRTWRQTRTLQRLGTEATISRNSEARIAPKSEARFQSKSEAHTQFPGSYNLSTGLHFRLPIGFRPGFISVSILGFTFTTQSSPTSCPKRTSARRRGTRSAASSGVIGSASCNRALRTRCRFLNRTHHCRYFAFSLRLPCARARRVSRKLSCCNQSGSRLMYLRIKSMPLRGIPAHVCSRIHCAAFHSAIHKHASDWMRQ